MSHLFLQLPADGWQRLLCDALWQSTMIGVCGWLAVRLLIRQSAARAWLLLVTLSACVLVPLASWGARQMEWTILTAQPEAATTLPAVAVAEPIVPQPIETPREAASPIVMLSAETPPVAASREEMSHQAGSQAEIVNPVITQRDDLPVDAAQNDVARPGITPIAAEEPLPASVAATQERANVVLLPLVPQAEPGANVAGAPKNLSEEPATSIRIRIEPAAASSPLTWLGIAWLVASSLRALRLTISMLATWRLLRRATPCREEALLAAAKAAAQRVGLRRPPKLVMSEQVQTPMVWALGRCYLLIPVADSTDEQKIDWTAAFTHELAHVVRGDGWARLWAELVSIALPLQPLVWLLKRSFRLACEEACDDWAVAAGTDPVDLADALTAWINVPRRAPTLAAIGMSSSKARTLRLLALREKPAARLSRTWRWLGIPAALVLMAGLAVAQSPTSRSKTDAAKPAPPNTSKSVGVDHTAPSKGLEAPYIIEPPDILLIDTVRLVPRDPVHIQPMDTVYVDTTLETKKYKVDSSGEIVLGPALGAVKISGLTRREAQDAVEKQLKKTFNAINVALTFDESRVESGIAGEHLVGPDGTINLGAYGTVHVDGDNVEQAAKAIEDKLNPFFFEPKVAVDIYAYNSKVFYVVLNTLHSRGDAIFRLPITGHETVLDGIAQVPGLRELAETNIFLARPTPGSVDRITAIDWNDAVHGKPDADPQVMSGDRVFIEGARGNYPVPPPGQQASSVASSESPKTEPNDSQNLKDINAPSHAFYYVILTDPDNKNGGSGTVLRFETSGDTNVLDAISRVPGLSNLADAKIKINRPTSASSNTTIDVNWAGLLNGAIPSLLSGDRLCIDGAWYDPHISTGQSAVSSQPTYYAPTLAAPPYPVQGPNGTTQYVQPAAPIATPQYAQPTPQGDYRPIPNYIPGGQANAPVPNYVPGNSSGGAIPNYTVPAPNRGNYPYIWPNASVPNIPAPNAPLLNPPVSNAPAPNNRMQADPLAPQPVLTPTEKQDK